LKRDTDTIISELGKTELHERSKPYHELAKLVVKFGSDAFYNGTKLSLPSHEIAEGMSVPTNHDAFIQDQGLRAEQSAMLDQEEAFQESSQSNHTLAQIEQSSHTEGILRRSCTSNYTKSNSEESTVVSERNSESRVDDVPTRPDYIWFVCTANIPLRDQESAARVLSLLHSLTSSGTSVSKSLLLAGKDKQAKWSATGQLEYIDAISFGLHAATVSALSDQSKLDKTLDLLETAGFIQQTLETDGSDTSIMAKVGPSAPCPLVEGGWKQAMIFVSFFFSGSEYHNKYDNLALLPSSTD
jgi:hypothetical protein